jgi:hypothetical protein
VNPEAQHLGSNPNTSDGLWRTYQNGNAYFTTNGVTNPTLHMRPGEMQRWRVLNAASGDGLATKDLGSRLLRDGAGASLMTMLRSARTYARV